MFGIKGGNGSTFIRYEWRSMPGSKYSNYEGGLVDTLVSDWSSYEICAHCGRKIVHIYWVIDHDEVIRPYGRDHLNIALGFKREISSKKAKEYIHKIQYQQEQIARMRDENIAKSRPTIREANRAFFKRNPHLRGIGNDDAFYVSEEKRLFLTCPKCEGLWLEALKSDGFREVSFSEARKLSATYQGAVAK